MSHKQERLTPSDYINQFIKKPITTNIKI